MTMLLPSALPCELRSQTPASPLRRSHRSVISPSQYHSPPPQESGLASLVSTGLFQTCRRLQAAVMSSSAPVPSFAPAIALAPPIQSGIRKSNRRLVITASSASELPETPSRRLYVSSSSSRSIQTPMRRNKRRAAVAFPILSSPLSAGAESDNSDKDFNDNRYSTPQPTKRPRLTTPPPPPNRGFRRGHLEESDDEDEIGWTDDEDRKLVDMVLQKLNLSKDEWEECARSLGKKDGRSVGKRWEDLLGNIGIREKRKQRAGIYNARKRRRN